MNTITPFVISRVFQAPRPLVFEVNTQPQHLAHWLSPEGFHNIHTDMDFRVGGRYHYGIQGPGGMEMWGRQDFRDITVRAAGADSKLLQSRRRLGRTPHGPHLAQVHARDHHV